MTNDMICEIANAHGWITSYEDDGEGHVEFSFRQASPLGEDFYFEIDPCTPDQVAAKVREYADDFDTDDHARMWVENSHVRGVPQSVRALLNDAEEIKRMLDALAHALEDPDKEGRRCCPAKGIEYIFDLVNLIADYNGWATLAQKDYLTGEITYFFSTVSPMGNFFNFSVEGYDAPNIVKAVCSFADNFDTDDFVRQKIANPDGPGIPNSIRSLVEEGAVIKRLLSRLAFALEHPEETHYTDHLAKVEWSIDDAIAAAEEQGVTLTHEQATAWWIENQKRFAEQITQTGNEILSNVDWTEAVEEPDEKGDSDA